MKLLNGATADPVSVPAKPDPRVRGGMAGTTEIDRAVLARRLRDVVEGEVRFDTQSRALYATDASNYRQPPVGVVIPKTIEDIVATHAVCREHGAPIVNRGAGTSLSGETVNFGVVLDHSKYLNRVLEIDSEERWAHCETGLINEKLNEAVGELGLVFPPDPSTHRYCTIGGNVGNNSCGVHSVQAQFYGHGPRVSDNTHSLEVLTYDGERFWVGETNDAELEAIVRAGGRKGEIYARLRDLRDRYGDLIREKYPPVDKLPRRVSGYNLDDLLPEKGFNVARALVGTESTCATILTARMLLTENTKFRTLLIVGYEDICVAADHVPEIMAHRPVALEGIDRILFRDEEATNMNPEQLSELPGGNAWLMVEFGGDSREEADEKAHALIADLQADSHSWGHEIVDDPEQAKAIWKVREAGLGATAFPPDGGDHWPGWEDSAVPPDLLGDYIRDLKGLYREYEYRGAFYGHLGQGCLHSRINFDLRTGPGIAKYRRFMEDAADLVVSYGGSLSGEHGDGQQRAELLEKQFGPELINAFREFKRIWDPEWKMNPGKVVDPYRLDEHLKLGADYNPSRPKTQFAYREDGYDFAHATLRCVGIGKCRKPDGVDVMCPSFIFTKDEAHTTRGRARLLFEMLEGEIVTDGWRSEEVFDSLELCLSCKGCTSDCPVHVDMPTYKAEFLHHHWKRRLRPRHAYAFGLIDQASRIASRAPRIVNFLTQTQPFSAVAKRAAGLTPERDIPEFAPVTLQRWFEERGGSRNQHGERVILWPDTFNNHFHTDVGVAAVEALEDAGFHVVVPEGHVCCGRPLYDYGFLNVARRYLRRTIAGLRDEIRAGTPVVGIEPSCTATFKDELLKLLPHDDDAERLAENTFHFSEFLHERGVELPKLEGDALLWGHCHHKATGGIDSEQEVMRAMGLDVRNVAGGCCGLAGSWGFERGHYEHSMQAGEHALLPAVREADETTVVVAGGFSCKTQIEQGGTGRRALHLAQLLQLARDGSTGGAVPPRPEGGLPGRPRPRTKSSLGAALAGAGLAALGTALAIGFRRSRAGGIKG